MPATDDDARVLPDQAAGEEASPNRVREAAGVRPSGAAARPASPPALSLMITNRQRAALRALGVSDEAIRLMTPAAAHARLRLTGPGV